MGTHICIIWHNLSLRPSQEMSLSECVGKMESKREIKRQGVRGGVVWREVGVWKTNLPKSIWEELCAKLSLTEILWSIKDLLIMPKHMKYSFQPFPPFSNTLLLFLSPTFLFSPSPPSDQLSPSLRQSYAFFGISSVSVCSCIQITRIRTRTLCSRREIRSDATLVCVCLSSPSLLSWRLLAHVQGFAPSANISTNTYPRVITTNTRAHKHTDAAI